MGITEGSIIADIITTHIARKTSNGSATATSARDPAAPIELDMLKELAWCTVSIHAIAVRASRVPPMAPVALG